MITGDEEPDGGTLRLGDSVELAYVDQSRDALDAEKTVWEEISDGHEEITVGDRKMNSRAYTSGFNFKGSDQQRKVGTLSGGERNRLHLAKLLRCRRQPPAPRRAHQRPRRRHPARARGGAPRVRRLRRRHLPRPLVPGPDRHPRARLRGRLAGALVRGRTSRPTRRTGTSAWAPRPTGPTASPTSGLPRRADRAGPAVRTLGSRRSSPDEIRRRRRRATAPIAEPGDVVDHVVPAEVDRRQAGEGEVAPEDDPEGRAAPRRAARRARR